MRIDTEPPKRLRWTIALAATTALLAIYNISKSLNTTSSVPPPPTTTVAAPKKSRPLQAGRDTQLDLNPLRFGWPETSGIGRRNIFLMQNIGITTDTSSGSIDPAPEPSSVAQTPRRIPLTFYGFADRLPESRRIFLQDNEQIFVARPGDTVERRYRIIAVSANSVTIEDLFQNYQQLIPLVER